MGSEEFTDNLEDPEVPASANTSHDSDPELRTKVTTRKHLYSLSDTEIAQSASEPNFEGSLQEAHW